MNLRVAVAVTDEDIFDPAGEQILRYAPTFVQLWQRARYQVAVPAGHRAVLTVGSEVSLWQPLFLEWVAIDANLDRMRLIASRLTENEIKGLAG